MGEDNLMKLSQIVALVSLYLELKGHGRGVKMMVIFTYPGNMKSAFLGVLFIGIYCVYLYRKFPQKSS